MILAPLITYFSAITTLQVTELICSIFVHVDIEGYQGLVGIILTV